MRKLYFLSFLFLLFLSSCGAVINESISKTYSYLPIDAKIAILEVKHNVPANVEKLGFISFGDSGFSTDCDYYSNLSKARKRAREIGANIVKINQVTEPSIVSSCYRMNISFYKYDGDVSQLTQISLQQN